LRRRRRSGSNRSHRGHRRRGRSNGCHCGHRRRTRSNGCHCGHRRRTRSNVCHCCGPGGWRNLRRPHRFGRSRRDGPRYGHHERVTALGTPHLETRRRNAALVDLIRSLARLALDLEHVMAIAGVGLPAGARCGPTHSPGIPYRAARRAPC
jgi:hypothetical protein